MAFRDDALKSKDDFLENLILARVENQVEREIFENWINHRAEIQVVPRPGDDEPDFLGAVSQIAEVYRKKGFTVNQQNTGVWVLLTIE